VDRGWQVLAGIFEGLGGRHQVQERRAQDVAQVAAGRQRWQPDAGAGLVEQRGRLGHEQDPAQEMLQAVAQPPASCSAPAPRQHRSVSTTSAGNCFGDRADVLVLSGHPVDEQLPQRGDAGGHPLVARVGFDWKLVDVQGVDEGNGVGAAVATWSA
jgi:hypothetical protein